MRVLIVDDEANARRRLQIMLEELDVEVVGEAANGVEALDLVETLEPDVLLLDIEMPEVDGFDVARRVAAEGPSVVFQTAHDEFALKAFEHAAVDYLVKPVDLRRLTEALDRVRARRPAEAPGPAAPAFSAELLDRLREAVGTERPRARRLLVRDGRGHRLLPLTQIVRFEAREGEVYALAGSRDYLADDTLTELENRLSRDFVRANRADLVSVGAVERIVPESDGSAQLVLVDGTRVRVSRRRAAEVRSRLAAEG